MFGLLGKKGRTEVGAVAGFGKIPALGDFVRTPSPSDEMIAFEAWLTRAIEAGEARAGSAFRDAFAAAPPYAFLWSGAIDKKQRGLLAGVILPSHDAVGRRFPLVVCAPLPAAALAAQPHVAPLVLHDFFHQAVVTAERAARMRTQAELHAQLSSLAAPSFESATASVARYASWARAQRAADVWTSLFGADAERAARYALYLLVEATAAYRGQETPPLSLGVRAPLGGDPGATSTMSAMWVDLVRQVAGWRTTVPSVFVPLSDDGPRALIQLGAEAPPSVLADLYAPSADSANVCELTPAADALMPSVFPSSVGRAMGDADAPIADVIQALGR
ncbi:MAG: type VI secretion system-associated protein TagF [Labilithrix sp.]|nr:type VI secretion system-associated protein TagF [Labilithrix sp.]MCW5834342.1 type VI secretion system-associated protein TagF [Labilithrix sp.]